VREMERRARRNETLAELGALSAGIAHELRNGLKPISGSVECLARVDAAGELPRPDVHGATVFGQFHGRGALWTLNAITRRVPWYGVFNATGQPAASVPAGFDAAGLPLAVQLVGRPGDEATLLSLAAQVEQARPWADRRPPL